MAFLVEAYTEDEAPNTKGGVDKRTVLQLDPRLAPVKVAVLPLSRNEALSPKARDLAAELRKHWNVDFDDAQAIGRRYRRQDEIGTPFCVTVDFDTLEDDAVTIRERDTMSQERVALSTRSQPTSGARLLGLLTDRAVSTGGRPDATGADRSLRVGPITVPTPVVLAPMAGVTNAAYRQLCREQGARAVRVRDDHQPRHRRAGPQDPGRCCSSTRGRRSGSVQLYGVDPVIMAQATEILCDRVRRGPRRPQLRLPGAQGDPQGRRRRPALEARPAADDLGRHRRGRAPGTASR